MRRIVCLNILVVSLLPIGHTQEIRREILDTVNSLKTFYFTDYVDFNKSDYWKYQWLVKNIDFDEIYSLSNSVDSIKKAYAYQLMWDKQAPKREEYYIRLLNQPPTLLWTRRHGDWSIITNYTDLSIYLFDRVYGLNLSEHYKDTIDSICLFSDGRNKSFQAYTLPNTKPRPAYYERVRKLALDSTISNSIYILLAKFKKQQDICLFLNYYEKPYGKNQILKALKYFPDTAFKPLIKKTIEECVDYTKNGAYSGLNYNIFCSLLNQYEGKWYGQVYYYAVNNLNPDELKKFENGMFYALTLYPNIRYTGTYNALINDASVYKPIDFYYNERIRIAYGFDTGN